MNHIKHLFSISLQNNNIQTAITAYDTINNNNTDAILIVDSFKKL